MIHYKSTPKAWQVVTKKLEEDLTQLGVKVLQMKEKFGDLRCYVSYDDVELNEKVNALIEQAEKDVEELCIVCGNKGAFGVDKNGWYGVMCDEHK